MPMSTRRATTCSICASVARSSITTTMTFPLTSCHVVGLARTGLVCRSRPASSTSSCTTRRSSRRASSMIRSNSRAIASGPSGPSAAMLRTCAQHVLLAVRLVDLDALLLLQPADLADAARPLVQQPHQHFVDPIDVLPQIVESHGVYVLARDARAFQPAHVPFDAIDRAAATRSPRRSATPARCRPPPRRRSAPTSATCSGREMPKPSAIGSAVCARIRRTSASAPVATWSRAPVTPSREMP